jgi:hypothetical protein
MNNYTLSMTRSLRKRALISLASVSNTTGIVTFNEGQMTMNSSIQYAVSYINSNQNIILSIQLEQQLKAGDNADQFNIYILQMTSNTTNPTNMMYEKNSNFISIYLILLISSVTLNFVIVYTRECLSCNKLRQSIIFKQLCSNNQISNPIRFLIQYANLSYTLSNPITVYSSYIPIQNIIVITRKIWIFILNKSTIFIFL